VPTIDPWDPARYREVLVLDDGTAVVPGMKLESCPWCDGSHTGRCPQVKALEYHENGQVKRVEYYDWGASLGIQAEPHNDVGGGG
jgi:hypothetical protein